MMQQLLSLLPKQIDSLALMLAVAGAVLGGILWLGGSRFSRTLVTLISVSTGALVGLQFPKWYPTGLEPWATAVLGALVLGISGYALHKVWVGLGLGLVMAGWTGLAVFTVFSDPGGFAWPVVSAESTVVTQLQDVWGSLNADVRRLLPYACAAAVLIGLSISVLWPRIGVVLLYSGAGMSLVVWLGAAVLNCAKREWLAVIPNQTSSQVIVLVSLVAFGAVLQWRAAPGGHVVHHYHP